MELLDKILDKCLRAGADMAEVYYQTERTLRISVHDAKIETINKAAPSGLAIRYFSSGKTAFAHTTDLSDSAIDRLISSMRNLAVKTGEDKYAVLPSPQKYPENLQIDDKEYSCQLLETKIGYIQELERLALGFDPLIVKSNSTWYAEYLTSKTIANSKGLNVTFDSTSYGLGVSVVAAKGEQMFPGEGKMWARRLADFPGPEKIAEIYAGRAARLVGGRPVNGGDYEIIFAPRAANDILWGLRGALDGENVYSGASFLVDKEGQKIASDNFSLYDDPLMPWGIGSCPADDEGVASAKQTLIENGILKGFLYDSRAAAKAGKVSTGSAKREYYSSLPAISASNFYIAPGSTKVDDVIASCRKGIIVEIAQGWGLQAVSGQYSAGINGILVEKGKKIRPVADVTVAGSAEDIFGGMGAICDDITFYDQFNSPSLYVKRMTVGA